MVEGPSGGGVGSKLGNLEFQFHTMNTCLKNHQTSTAFIHQCGRRLLLCLLGPPREGSPGGPMVKEGSNLLDMLPPLRERGSPGLDLLSQARPATLPARSSLSCALHTKRDLSDSDLT